MPIPLRITVLNVPRSAALEARVRKMADKLEKIHSRIVSCRVSIEELRRHRSTARLFHVRVDLRIPGKEIVSNHRHAKDAHVALRESFLSLRRQLEDATRVARGEVKKHPVRPRRAAQGESS
ncbi:MAG TPA: HPF/RaiA family ribosome-associated protein [Burkholderiales bacterium]|nr:HPF/RaiA family ribosome-associated protein [Burkholderiales bacterium]